MSTQIPSVNVPFSAPNPAREDTYLIRPYEDVRRVYAKKVLREEAFSLYILSRIRRLRDFVVPIFSHLDVFFILSYTYGSAAASCGRPKTPLSFNMILLAVLPNNCRTSFV